MGVIMLGLLLLGIITRWLCMFMRALWKTDSMTEACKVIIDDLKRPIDDSYLRDRPTYYCARCKKFYYVTRFGRRHAVCIPKP
jgi:hypothetical protein